MADINKTKNVYNKIKPFRIEVKPHFSIDEAGVIYRYFEWSNRGDKGVSNIQQFYLFQLFCLQVSMGIINNKNYVNEFEPNRPIISPKNAKKLDDDLQKVYDQIHNFLTDYIVDKPKKFKLNGNK